MSRSLRRTAPVALAVTAALVVPAVPSAAGTPSPSDDPAAHHLTLDDGSKVTWYDDGTANVTDTRGATRPLLVPPVTAANGFGQKYVPSTEGIKARAAGGTYRLGGSQSVDTMNTHQPLPKKVVAATQARASAAKDTAAPVVPSNDGLTSSFSSWLNAQGVNTVGAFADADRYLGALPGAGQIITNVSIGDVDDDTTVVKDGRRYLDVPSMPLIPTYVSDGAGNLDPAGTTQGQDPALGEVLLDFSMMSPLPHDRQRPEALGSGASDLLGIAPGADYRLVVPQEPSFEGIRQAFLAAAHQTPRPTVITASLGAGTDTNLGFPGRWLEDDPAIRETLRQIVASGITVVVSSNDGTRLALPVSVGPDGGSTPTERTTRKAEQTTLDDVMPTSVPTKVMDTGVIAAGSTTVDDTLTTSDVRQATWPTTRYNGSAAYASGFGSRIDLSAPGDNLPSFAHVEGGGPQAVGISLGGGTSASAPMIAAAAAVVQQAAQATGQSLTPQQVRKVLVDTARPVASPPQADQALSVGPQIDVTRAFESVLAHKYPVGLAAVRLSVAQRQLIPSMQGTFFEEDTNPDAIDLAGPVDANGNKTGQNAVSPITFGLDLTGPTDGLDYRLVVGGRTLTSPTASIRVLPAELFEAAGVSMTSGATASIPVRFEAVRRGQVVAALGRTLTFLLSDGTYTQAQAPTVPGSVALGQDVTVTYDLTGVRDVADPRLVVSSVGHYTPAAGVDIFNEAWSAPLTDLKGTVTVPAAAFAAGGGGLYGVGLQTAELGGVLKVYGDFRALRVGPGADQRPDPLTFGTSQGPDVHAAAVRRGSAPLPVRWDVRAVKGADGAALEVLAPAPTLAGSLNTATNQNGTQRDDDGFNHPSSAWVELSGTHGSIPLDLGALGLPTGLQYPVRVIATKDGKPLGQASASSFLQYDDGDVVPGQVEGFTVDGGTAYLSTDTIGGESLLESSTVPYDLATGTTGKPINRDADGSHLQLVSGVDKASGNALFLERPWGANQPLIGVVNTATDARLTSVDVDTLPGVTPRQSFPDAATVDPDRGRGYVEVYDGAQGLSLLYTVDMASGAVTGPIVLNPDNRGRTFANLAVDASTGAVFATTVGTMGPCLSGRVPYWMVKVDVVARAVTPVATMPLCTASVAPDDAGGKLYVSVGAAAPSPFGGDFPLSSVLTMDQGTLAVGPQHSTGTRGPAWLTLDKTHHLLVETSIFESARDTDNNPMSEVTLIDPDTGDVLERKPVVNLFGSTLVSNFNFTSTQGLHLDEKTRTAYVVDAWAGGLTRFSY